MAWFETGCYPVLNHAASCAWRPRKAWAEPGEGPAHVRWHASVGFWCTVVGLMYLVMDWKFW